ncbi:MAG: GEVED domain-containing protein [Chloroflexota bacterium]
MLASLCLIGLTQQPVQANPDQKQVYQNATFTVLYRTADNPGDCPPPDAEVGELQAWPAEAQAAMNHVVDILDNLINSDVPIAIDACYQTDNTPGSLAFASEIESFTQDDVASLPVPGVAYAVALANAIDGNDLNGERSEILTSVNSNIEWDYCTVNCVVDANSFDFVSTMVHEFIHGLGFSMSFSVDNADNPTIGSYQPSIADESVYTYDGENTVQKLTDLPNNSAELLDAFLGGSGTVVLAGNNTVAANDDMPAFVYSTTSWESGSSMSHFDDNHPSNLGRIMNAATDSGPGSRTVDALTLMLLKDIGLSVDEAVDRSDGTTYPTASHFAGTDMVNHMRFGPTVSTESSNAPNDASDDGIARVGDWTVGANGGTVAVDIQASTAGARGCFNGWADWNQDNDFADDGEQIFNMVSVSQGNNNHSFDIPAEIGDEDTIRYRFRLHQDWDNDGGCDDQVGVSSTITLMNGEVEDYDFSLITTPVEIDQFVYLPIIRK